jgi:hypothetical protein
MEMSQVTVLPPYLGQFNFTPSYLLGLTFDICSFAFRFSLFTFHFSLSPSFPTAQEAIAYSFCMENNVSPEKNVPLLVDEILHRFSQLQAEEMRQNVPCFYNTEGERSYLLFQVPVKIDVSVV